MNDITPFQAVGAFLLLLALVFLVLCASAFALIVGMARAPWRRIAKRRAEQERRRVLEAIVQHKYGRGDVA